MVRKKTSTEPAKQTKKRGRPKKTQTKTKKKEPVEKIPIFATEEKKNEEIVLCLPLNMSDFNKCDNKEEYKEVFKKEKKRDAGTDNQFTITDMMYAESSEESIDSDELNKKTAKKIKNLEKEIKELKGELAYYKKTFGNIGLIDNNVYKINIKLYDVVNGKKINIKKTDISCWWCTCKFDNMPIYLPEKVVDDTFYVFGNFCMPECAAAYNEYDLNDYKKEDRYCLLNKLYPRSDSKPINLSPRREFLIDYGGPIDIKKYRITAHNHDKSCRLIFPPMKPLTPIIEERDMGKSQLKQNLSSDGLVLKRTKPLYTTTNKFFDKICSSSKGD